MTAHPPLSPCHAHSNPVRGPITSSPVTSHLHESLQQHRRISVALLPVSANPFSGEGQSFAGQIPDAYPGKQKEARVAHHPVQPLCPVLLVPANPAVPLRQRPSRGRKQQTAQSTPPSPHQEIALVRSKRPPVTQWVVACHIRSEEHTSELQSRLHLVC